MPINFSKLKKIVFPILLLTGTAFLFVIYFVKPQLNESKNINSILRTTKLSPPLQLILKTKKLDNISPDKGELSNSWSYSTSSQC